MDEYRILTFDGKWIDCGESFSDPDSAVTFAHSEIGVPWIVVNEAWEPIEYGDRLGLHPERAKRTC